MFPGQFSWFQLCFHGSRSVFMVFHGLRFVIHGSRSVSHDSRLVLMVLGWYISKLSLGGAK